MINLFDVPGRAALFGEKVNGGRGWIWRSGEAQGRNLGKGRRGIYKRIFEKKNLISALGYICLFCLSVSYMHTHRHIQCMHVCAHTHMYIYISNIVVSWARLEVVIQ